LVLRQALQDHQLLEPLAVTGLSLLVQVPLAHQTRATAATQQTVQALVLFVLVAQEVKALCSLDN
jgi:hypothetical protein